MAGAAQNNIYMATANDRLETPLYVTDRACEMAEYLNCSIATLHSMISKQKAGKRGNSKASSINVYSFKKEDDDD